MQQQSARISVTHSIECDSLLHAYNCMPVSLWLPLYASAASGSKPPTAVTAVPGVNLGSIRVMWVAPLDTGGVSITGYYIQYRIWGTASYAIQLSQPQPTEATISGLRLGTTYQVRLAALTAIGIGPYCCTQKGSQVFARTRDGKLIILCAVMKYGTS